MGDDTRMSAEEYRGSMHRRDLHPLHRKQLSDVEEILTEALHALLRFEDKKLPFCRAEAGWIEVRNRLAFFELLSPQSVLRGLIERQPHDRCHSLADRLWEAWRALSSWGPGRAGTWEEFENDESQHLRATIANLVSFLIKWRLFFDYLGDVLTPNALPADFLRHVEYRHEDQHIMPTAEPSVPVTAPMDQTADQEVAERSSEQLVSPTEADVPCELFQPDGFFGVSSFRFRGIPVDLGSSLLCRKILASLWDDARKCPQPPKPRRAVIEDAWGVLDAPGVSDNTFNSRVAALRAKFDGVRLPLRIDNVLDRIELVPR